MPLKNTRKSQSPSVTRSHAERERLFTQNVNLAYSACNTWTRKNSGFVESYRLEYDDLNAIALAALWYATGIWNPAKGQFSTIATIAVHSRLATVLKHFRRAQRGEAAALTLSLDAKVGTGGEDIAALVDRLPAPAHTMPESAFLRSEEASELWAAVDSLPARDAGIIRAFYEEGDSATDIARFTGATRQAVGNTLRRACAKLRDQCPQLEHR